MNEPETLSAERGGCSLERLVSRLGAHIAQMASHQRERRAGQLLIEAHAACKQTNNDPELVKDYAEVRAKHYASLQAHAKETERMRKALNGLDEEYRRAFKEWYCRD